MDLKMGAEEVITYLEEIFPGMRNRFTVLELEPLRAKVAMQGRDEDIRPGGTLSGPSMFALADCAFYVLLLAMIGRKALAVTTNASIDFMRKPNPGRLVADVRLLKLGRSLAVGDIFIYS